MSDQQDVESNQLLRALVALAVAERDERASGESATRRSELLLADAGLDSSAIAALTGKNVGAVRKAIQRDRKATGKGAGK